MLCKKSNVLSGSALPRDKSIDRDVCYFIFPVSAPNHSGSIFPMCAPPDAFLELLTYVPELLMETVNPLVATLKARHQKLSVWFGSLSGQQWCHHFLIHNYQRRTPFYSHCICKRKWYQNNLSQTVTLHRLNFVVSCICLIVAREKLLCCQARPCFLIFCICGFVNENDNSDYLIARQ